MAEAKTGGIRTANVNVGEAVRLEVKFEKTGQSHIIKGWVTGAEQSLYHDMFIVKSPFSDKKAEIRQDPSGVTVDTNIDGEWLEGGVVLETESLTDKDLEYYDMAIDSMSNHDYNQRYDGTPHERKIQHHHVSEGDEVVVKARYPNVDGSPGLRVVGEVVEKRRNGAMDVRYVIESTRLDEWADPKNPDEKHVEARVTIDANDENVEIDGIPMPQNASGKWRDGEVRMFRRTEDNPGGTR